MGDSKEPWVILDWDELERDAESEDDARRFRAVVKAFGKAERIGLLDGTWNRTLRRAISEIRYRVAHCCHNPTVEEASYAVSAFRSLEGEKREPERPEKRIEKPRDMFAPFGLTRDDISNLDERARHHQAPQERIPPQRSSYRIFQFAQLMGVSSDTMLEMVRKCGIDASTPLFILNAEQIARIRAEFDELKKGV